MHIQPLIISLTSHFSPLTSSTCHDIDRSDERRGAIDASCRTFEHLDADDVVEIDGQVHRIVSRLWVTDIDTVEQQNNLILCAPSDGDVGLGPDGSPLSDIDAHGVLQ